MTRNKVLMMGILGSIGAVVTIALSLPFSYTNALAQMTMQMPPQQQPQGNNTMMQHGMFSAHGMSMVENVRITGVTITGNNEITINLAYTGNASAPSVTVVAMTNHAAMMMAMMMTTGSANNSMSGMMGSGMMTNNNNNAAAMQSQTGSSVIDGGWHSGSAVKVKLDGVGVSSAYNAPDLHVCIFPHLT